MYCHCHVYPHTSRVSALLCCFRSSWGTRLAFQKRLEGRKRLLIVLWLCIVTDYWRNRSCASHSSPGIPKCACYEMAPYDMWKMMNVLLLWNWTGNSEKHVTLWCFLISTILKKKKKFCQIVWFSKKNVKKVNFLENYMHLITNNSGWAPLL